MIVEKHAMAIAAFAAFECDRNDLSALRVISESRRIRHANEFELHQRLVDLERFRHQRAELPSIGTIGDYQEFAVIEAIRADWKRRVRQRHGERPRADFIFVHHASPTRDGRATALMRDFFGACCAKSKTRTPSRPRGRSSASGCPSE